MSPLDPSDVALLIDLGLALILATYFALGRPRTWFLDRLGWVIFGYAVAVVALLALIVYGIVFGQRVTEPLRFLVGGGLGVALIAKTWSVYRERREGRVARDLLASSERSLMSMNTSHSKPAAVAKATAIWFVAQRVLRTIVQTAIPAFLAFALVLPAIIEALGLPVDSELRLWLVGVAAVVTAVAAAITRVMAIPAVNAWLTKIGLGSVPASAISTRTSATGAPVVVVKEDPKVAGRG